MRCKRLRRWRRRKNIKKQIKIEKKRGSLVNTCVCLKQNTLASNKTTDLADLTDLFIPIMTDSADFRFLGESPSGWLQEPCEALIRVIRINPSNGLPISENLFNPLNLWLKIKISAQSAQSFRRNLFIKDIPLRDD